MITRIYDREYLTLDYDPAVPCIIATFLKFMMLEEFKSAQASGLYFVEKKIKETGRMMWIVDSKLTLIDDECAKYAVEDWTPRALAVGIKHVAFVISANQWGQIGLDEYAQDTMDKGMTTASFKDVESAKSWLRGQTQ
ncbi:hypothetical protein [Chryseolinea soli]|uniref:STAS/SEC14 domain-containing protein n=1 Tax=Chryseolinea soli TaxID=2321403 RepID=A0A385SJX4_9BACT|nr:hypothetical protein [Chryseolinea soli]AYB32053.1 hypothetical protein D4L85_16405 [Chryseolinea soli]